MKNKLGQIIFTDAKKYWRNQSATRQRGAVAIFVALSMAVMIGFAGLAVDLGRMYVNKSEVQSAADSCALAASTELTCDSATGACNISFLTNAENAGLTVGNRNSKNFQASPANILAANVTFSIALNGAYSPSASANVNSRFVKCTARLQGIIPWFMQIMGVGEQTVTAEAVATLAPGQTANVLPMGICAPNPGVSGFGFEEGQWYTGKFGVPWTPTGACGIPITTCSGAFNWIDLNGGGVPEIVGALGGTGIYGLPPAGTEAGANGAIAAANFPWNTRFGLYSGGPATVPNSRLISSPPDHTGYSYTGTNWPSCQNALPDYYARRQTDPRDRYGSTIAAGNTMTGLSIANGTRMATSDQLETYGRSRRLAVAPVIDCNETCAPGAETEVQGYACIFMLHPIDGPQPEVRLEYRGLASDPESPCASVGIVGPANGSGPLVPALVQ